MNVVIMELPQEFAVIISLTELISWKILLQIGFVTFERWLLQGTLWRSVTMFLQREEENRH